MTTAELAALLDTPAAFRQWLKTKEPGEVVGNPMIREACPIAQFLRANGAESVSVSLDEVRASGCDDYPVWPRWPLHAQRWPSKFTWEGKDVGRTITAAECLAILDEIEGGEG